MKDVHKISCIINCRGDNTVISRVFMIHYQQLRFVPGKWNGHSASSGSDLHFTVNTSVIQCPCETQYFHGVSGRAARIAHAFRDCLNISSASKTNLTCRLSSQLKWEFKLWKPWMTELWHRLWAHVVVSPLVSQKVYHTFNCISFFSSKCVYFFARCPFVLKKKDSLFVIPLWKSIKWTMWSKTFFLFYTYIKQKLCH